MLIAPGGQPGSLPCRIQTPHLHTDGGEAGQTQCQHRDDRHDRKGRLDGRTAGVIA
ncbi:hypothetical protein JRC04_26195 [Mycolicibacterium sp. S2-37]|nr:hypothetical protein [Mycolicibacterium sp. S2-37]